MRKIKIDNIRIGDEVLVISYNPPLRVRVADTYELPFEQVPITDNNLIRKYSGKNVPIVEVFIDGKVRSFISDVINLL